MLSLTCPKCEAGLGDGLDLRKSSCHACGYHDGSSEPELAPEPKPKGKAKVEAVDE